MVATVVKMNLVLFALARANVARTEKKIFAALQQVSRTIKILSISG
jgi:hypothetical protein